jgi:hypothetical protein
MSLGRDFYDADGHAQSLGIQLIDEKGRLGQNPVNYPRAASQ